MGYADGYYYGQGKIICDTATFTAGDTIRVRSMTDATKIWDKTVVTAGTPLIFDVPGKDYYKICTVQEISDVETEIGGVYKTIDYGQTLFINVLDKTTLGGIQGILNAHQETSLLAIGDTLDILVGGIAKTIKLVHLNAYASHEAIFAFDRASNDGYPVGTNALYDTRTQLFSYFDSIYANMTAEDKALIKDKVVNYYSQGSRSITQKIWCPTTQEVFGDISEGNTQFAGYMTQANRIKFNEDGVATYWQLTSVTQYANQTDCVTGAGAKSYTASNIPAVAHFHLTADM